MASHAAALICGIVLLAISASDSRAQELSDDELFDAMVVLVVSHDVSILAGVLPFPTVQYAAETVEFSSNLALKGLRPWLKAPPDIRVDPGAPRPADARYDAPDQCGIEFEVLSPRAGYENQFGVVSFRDPYVHPHTGQVYRWFDARNPTNTRWGFLGPPELYHANSSVELSLDLSATVRQFDIARGAFENASVPFDPDFEDPQLVYLPIGTHEVQWRAGTQLSWISDVGVPAVLLAVGLLTEVQKAYAGAKAAREVKEFGLSHAVRNAEPDPRAAARVREGARRFEAVWQNSLKKRQRSRMLRKVQKDLACEIGGVALDVVERAADVGIEVLEEETADTLRRAGVLTPAQADLLQAVYTTFAELRLSLGVTAILATLDCNDEDRYETLITVLGTLIETFDVVGYLSRETGVSHATQLVHVLDSTPPVIQFPPTPYAIEATDFGGTTVRRARAVLFENASAYASDDCGRTPVLSLDAPELLPLGTSQIVWTARDLGPNPDDGQDYAPTAVQTIVVRDTQRPILLAPASKVLESATSVALADAAIGDAAAVDLVDAQPRVENDAPAIFPTGRRTRVTWTATDDSGNRAEAAQTVTVKALGANRAPTAVAVDTQTTTANPVDIRLTGVDPDVVDGVADPLTFRIASRPTGGEFVAPLYPFFIEDYRTRPSDGLPGFDPVVYPGTDGVRSYIRQHYCLTELAERVPPVSFVHDARFVQVTNDGVRYVLDDFFTCPVGEENPENHARFSKWSADGEFLGQVRIGSSETDRPVGDTFVLDRDGRLYYVVDLEPGSSSNELYLSRCGTDWPLEGGTTSVACDRSYRFDSSSAPGSTLDARSLRYARIDSRAEVAYVADSDGVYAFELDDSSTRFLGEIGPTDESGQVIDGWVGLPQAIEVGSDGSVYVADLARHRIHKLDGIRTSAAGALVPGAYIGWSGRCVGSDNRACDEDLGRSRGYSCTFAPDSCADDPLARSGDLQGQFDTPRFIAIDPNDVLYVADYGNARVQRLSPDGSFAGEAVSAGTGINRGERPSFVIGNMGAPASVSVNSSQFFVVDRNEQFVHVFGTLPFKDVADDAATVTYVSDQDFPNPLVSDVDTFSFTVSDGLTESAPANVAITVDRSYRAPVARDETRSTPEDTAFDLVLPVEDPDGIAGRDFLGLDVLTYRIVADPEHGTLTGSDDTWTYTPAAGFYGTDRFRFAANDGRDDSNEATVTIDVIAENDPPVVTVVAPERVALGFPILVDAELRDDPAAGFEATVDWGDGSSDVTGGVETDAESERALVGVSISAPPAPDLAGRLFAQHTFEATGARTVDFCVTDDGGLEGCDSIVVEVERLVSLGVGGVVFVEPLADDETSLEEVPDGVRFSYEVTVHNGMPSIGSGITAEAVRIEAELPERLNVAEAVIDAGTCARVERLVTCEAGALEPDASVTLSIVAFGAGTVRSAEPKDLNLFVRTDSDALEDEMEFALTVDVVPNLADGDADGMSDGFELAFGLDLDADDAEEDPDLDGLTNEREFVLGTSPRDADTDADLLPDLFEVTVSRTDPTRADSDGDDMPDGWELRYRFDPLNAADGAIDTDRDGRANRDEFATGTNPHLDDVPPDLYPPADLAVAATGRLTIVDVGEASAVDARDGVVQATPDPAGPYAPGPNRVAWQAWDSIGNRAVAEQHVDVTPLVDLAIDQTVVEGDTARVLVALNGDAPSYPVTIPYTIAGSASAPEDHDATSSTVTIESGTMAEITIGIVSDAAPDSGETIDIAIGVPEHAVPGVRRTHRITIEEANAPPRVSMSAMQQGRIVTTITRDGGPVTIAPSVLDGPGESHTFDWLGTDERLAPSSLRSAAELVVDPAAISPGLVALALGVTDGDGASTTVHTFLRVRESMPVLYAANDTDADGVDDATEGLRDVDGDRVPAFVDAIDQPHMLAYASDGTVVETETGLMLRLGETVFEAGGAYPTIEERAAGSDSDYGYPNGVIDAEILGVPRGGVARVVVPLHRPATEGASYRTFDGAVWRDLALDSFDRVASATGARGDGVACPPPGSPAFVDGIRAGAHCVELTLSDGGPNDADGHADGVIRAPGGVAIPVGVTAVAAPASTAGATADGTYTMLELVLQSPSGDAVLEALTLRASGSGDDRSIRRVSLVLDHNRNGVADSDETVLTDGAFATDNGVLRLELAEGLEIPYGDTAVLVVYRFQDQGR